ncbi:MAG: hypothetical protein ACE5HK_04450 [Candidatus Methylomirabilales bacterium]
MTTATRLEPGWRLFLLLLVLGLVSGCVRGSAPKNVGTATALQPAVGLGDVPIPSGFTQVHEESIVVEFGRFRGGWVVYSGDKTPSAVIAFYRDIMPVEGWKPVASFVAKQSLFVYTKEDRACVISVTRTGFTGSTRIEVRVGLADLTPEPSQKQPRL